MTTALQPPPAALSPAPTAAVTATYAPPDAPQRRVELTVHLGDDAAGVYLASPDPVLALTPEAVAALALIPAMRRGLPLRVDAPLSAQFGEALATIQAIYRTWRPELHAVPVLGARPRPDAPPPTGRVAAFFSGGVDSFYTLLQHEAEVTDVIFVHGFDVRLDDAALRRAAGGAVREVARALGKRVLEVETNLRALLDPHLPWGYAHGAALATVAHALSSQFDRVYVPATDTYRALFPWGSHPVLDPRWSTEGLTFVHDGCEARRVDKVARVARSEVALATLRVCYRNPGGAYNCGRCEKCLRTMVALEAAGALARCRTFPVPLDPARVRALRIRHENVRTFVRENLDALRAAGARPELQAALQALLTPTPRREPLLRQLARTVVHHYPRLHAAVRRVRGRRSRG